MTSRDASSIVLVVEDEPQLRVVLVQAFEDAGFTVLEAFDGDNAVQILEKNANRVRAVFSDVNLSGSMNGVLLARHARMHWPWIGIILASGRPKPDDAAMPDNTRFFSKPYDIGAIVNHVCALAG